METQQNNFSKKPWIPEFFPQGTIVEFDTMLDSKFGSAGVGTVDTLAQSNYQNTVLCLKDVTLTKGEFFTHGPEDTYNLSSSYVTRILKRGPRGYIEEHNRSTKPLFRTGFGKRIYRYDINPYFYHLIYLQSKVAKQHGVLNVDAMARAFIKSRYGFDRFISATYSTKVVKKWFNQNYNRFLVSERDQEISDYYERCRDNFLMEDDFDLIDKPSSSKLYSRISKERIVSDFEKALQQKFHHYKWGVLTKSLVQKYLKYWLPLYRVQLVVKNRPDTYFFTDVENMDGILQEIIKSQSFHDEELVAIKTTVAVEDDLSLFEPSEHFGIQAFLDLGGMVDYLHYLLTEYDPEYTEDTSDVLDDQSLNDYCSPNDSDFR